MMASASLTLLDISTYRNHPARSNGTPSLEGQIDIICTCMYDRPMDYEWEPEKAAQNLRTHDVRLSYAADVLEDAYALTREDASAQGEQRWVSVGMDGLGRVLTVVYTYRGERIRLLSARRATRREREHYERERS
jgi:uncharacterized protein